MVWHARRVVPIIVLVALVGGWWLSKRDTLVVTPSAVAMAAIDPPQSSESRADLPATTNTTAPATAAGIVNFSRMDGSGETLELHVVDGIALWNPTEHRLRVLLTDDALSPAERQQMLGYLRDERLDDSGRPYGVLELHFRSDSTTLDRSGLTSASLTVAAAGGVVRDTAEVQSSIQWTGGVQLLANQGGAKALPQLELTAAGNTRSTEASSWRQDWQISVAVPVVQASEP